MLACVHSTGQNKRCSTYHNPIVMSQCSINNNNNNNDDYDDDNDIVIIITMMMMMMMIICYISLKLCKMMIYIRIKGKGQAVLVSSKAWL